MNSIIDSLKQLKINKSAEKINKTIHEWIKVFFSNGEENSFIKFVIKSSDLIDLIFENTLFLNTLQYTTKK